MTRLPAIALLLALPACGSSPDGTSRRPYTRNVASEAADRTADAAASYFHDTQDYDTAEFGENGPPCAFPVGAAVVAWPKAMKAMLSTALFDLEGTLKETGLSGVLRGIYLVRPVGDEAESGKTAVTCLHSSGRAAIFVSAPFAIDDRRTRYGTAGDGKWETYQMDALGGSELQQLPDLVVATVLHETFHALDFTRYTRFEGNAGTFRGQGRQDLYDLSWEKNGGSKFHSIVATFLADPAAPSAQAQEASDYKYLAEQTNFASPYAAANSIEDFAVTLETYYLATHYQAYQRRVVSAQPKGAVLYTFDQAVMLKANAQLGAKACQGAALVFAGVCGL